MSGSSASTAILSATRSEAAFCKFLSANDAGRTGAHQCGILISTSAWNMLFEGERPEGILKRNVRIRWQGGISTDSRFTWYSSKTELRLTCFGSCGPELLYPERTGSLFVLTRQCRDEYSGFFLDTEDEIEQFMAAFGLGQNDTNKMIRSGEVGSEKREEAQIRDFIAGLDVEFPAASVMSDQARVICSAAHPGKTSADDLLLGWIDTEYSLFRALERERYGKIVAAGFSSMDDFVSMANTVLNRRKSRAGKSLEMHLGALFVQSGLRYAAQVVTEGGKRPDFIFPSAEAYRDPFFSVSRLFSLAAKTTCKDRWRQILTEADRLRDRTKYLCTLQQGISAAQISEMNAEKVRLVVPKKYLSSYPRECWNSIWTLDKFILFIQEAQKDCGR